MAGKISFFTAEQQEAFEHLTEAQKIYVRCRAEGYSKSDSWRRTGYKGKNAGQVASLLERDNAIVRELAEVAAQHRATKLYAATLGIEEKQVTELVERKREEKAIEAISSGDAEIAKRVLFYQDIINGKIRSVKIKKRYNKAGELIERIVEETSDVEVRMKARRELDRLLGLNSVMEVDKLQVGQITVNIVDASKREELADSRNNVDLTLDIDKYAVVDGEEVVVVDETTETADGESQKDKFFDTVGGGE